MNLSAATVRVSVPDGHRRSWRTLWRLRPADRVIFVGRITGGHLTTRMNGTAHVELRAEDALATLERRLA